ncbi:MAG: AEC family transporter [Ruminococcaceae bacterium]|nr:AEC family transporter [Oscillospiraceae bacterium]
MLSNFLYAFNGVMPIFLVALVGYILKQKNFLSDDFVKVADKLVFRVMLPCLLFTKVAYTDMSAVNNKDLTLMAFCVIAAVVLTTLLCIIVPLFIKDKAKVGAFIQGVFRSNVAFLGVPFAINLFGEEGGTLASMVLAVVVPVYNVLAVTVLCIFNPDKDNETVTLSKRIGKIILGIVKNPLIISIVVALPFGIFGIGSYLPDFVEGTVEYFAKASTTLALVTIGASFKISELKGRIGLAAAATVIKTVVLPASFMLFTYYAFGFTGVHLGIIMIVFGTPTAISSYIMAKNMNADASLANQIVLLSTLCSMFTVFAFSFILKTVGLIG